METAVKQFEAIDLKVNNFMIEEYENGYFNPNRTTPRNRTFQN